MKIVSAKQPIIKKGELQPYRIPPLLKIKLTKNQNYSNVTLSLNNPVSILEAVIETMKHLTVISYNVRYHLPPTRELFCDTLHADEHHFLA